ncbi:glycosyltransferase [Pseudodesulfovibrio sp.]|uniref:glycosyltransferase n=1 Tax=Pseudodesulfovibrio sp. TaxID=2035812 RepID=UPI00261346B9|nr:glycosyltransferase [Pseudodesulfovibrio sp.]MDD3313249.1 glycosyl transferase family 2 [Pseudodesulfovibrio sp.]
MSRTLIPHYTDAVLAFDMTDGPASAPAAAPTADEVRTFTDRTLSLFAKSGASVLVLFGLGSGRCALALAAGLPEAARLVVCETDTGTARKFLAAHPEWRDEDGRAHLAADSSAWALLYLLALSGANAENGSTALCPDLGKADRDRYRALQRRFLQARPHLALNSSYLSHVAVQAPDLSVGAILSPDEPELDTFFAQFPDWVREVVVIWDAETAPDREFACAAPVRHLAHPLDDFATQRNRMLDACQGEWVLYLDGDERFSEDVWSLFTALMLIKRLAGCYFPRMTFFPDETRCKVGFGLWPDLQLRLFRREPSVRFERPVHERLIGVEGRVALAMDAPILHYSRLTKSPEMLAAKLKRFDAAGAGRVTHRLNDDYPTLERARFDEASFLAGALQVLLLEENPA